MKKEIPEMQRVEDGAAQKSTPGRIDPEKDKKSREFIGGLLGAAPPLRTILADETGLISWSDLDKALAAIRNYAVENRYSANDVLKFFHDGCDDCGAEEFEAWKGGDDA